MVEQARGGHTPVLLHEAVDCLNLRDGSVFVDATLGNAGHTLEVFRRFRDHVTYIGIDADSERIAYAKELLEKSGCRAKIFTENFRNLNDVVKRAGIAKVSAILFDLGLNSEHLESSGRGFSFLRDEPLLMTFTVPAAGMLTAREIVNQYDRVSLEKIFREYGEERYARTISAAIIESRSKKPIRTTFELLEVLKRSLPRHYERGRIHFATRTFQALRIATNDELANLSSGLSKGFSILQHGGRIAVLSFHSIEDRIVKNYFRTCAAEKIAVLVTKKPIVSSGDECRENPRARSAKLRILERV